MRIIIAGLMVAVPLAALAAVAPEGGLVGKAAPEIGAKYWLNSPALSLKALEGRIVVVEFWATWCPPCRKSIPHLIELHKKYGPQGVVIVGLTDEPRAKVEPFAKEMGMTYPVGGESDSGRQYGVRGIPHAFLVDTAGKVTWEGHPMSEDFERAIEDQLKKTPPKVQPRAK